MPPGHPAPDVPDPAAAAAPPEPPAWVRGPRRPRPHPRWRRPPWRVVGRRVRRRSGRWWLSAALAFAAGATAVLPFTGDAGGRPAVAPDHAVTAEPGRVRIPEGHVALSMAPGDPPLPAVEGDHVDLLATDLATGRATVVARGALVVDVDGDGDGNEPSLLVAVRRGDLLADAAAATQGLLVPVLLPAE